MRQSDADLYRQEELGIMTSDEVSKLVKLRDERRDWGAEKAAPYMHPRLTSIELDTNAAEHESWLDVLDD
jgi:hypothetical protein